MHLLYVLLLLVFTSNCIGFFAVWYDKKQAKKHQYRISEKTLLSIAFVGGSIGSSAAMLIFRHKTSKIAFLRKFFLIVFFQISVFWYFILTS